MIFSIHSLSCETWIQVSENHSRKNKLTSTKVFIISEAAIGGVLQEKVFLKISKNTFSLEYVWAAASFILFSYVFSKIWDKHVVKYLPEVNNKDMSIKYVVVLYWL